MKIFKFKKYFGRKKVPITTDSMISDPLPRKINPPNIVDDTSEINGNVVTFGASHKQFAAAFGEIPIEDAEKWDIKCIDNGKRLLADIKPDFIDITL